MIYRGIYWKTTFDHKGHVTIDGTANCTGHSWLCPIKIIGHPIHEVTVLRSPERITVDVTIALNASYWKKAHHNALEWNLVSHDNVPWEIHQIYDETAYRAALAAYTANT